MNLAAVPQPVLLKLLQLDQIAQQLSAEADRLDERVNNLRHKGSGSGWNAALEAELKQALTAQPKARQRADKAQHPRRAVRLGWPVCPTAASLMRSRSAARMATSSAMLDRIALHEAGHAVVARMLGLKCGGAAVADDHGRANYQDTTDDSIAAVVVHMSGAASEHVLIGNIADGIAGDRQQITSACEARNLSQDAVDRLWRVACLLVKAHEIDIRVLAVELQRRRQLSGEEIDALSAVVRDHPAKALIASSMRALTLNVSRSTPLREWPRCLTRCLLLRSQQDGRRRVRPPLPSSCERPATCQLQPD